jgi:hypothetical protein
VWSGLCGSSIGEDLFRVAAVWLAVEAAGNLAGVITAAQYAMMLAVGLFGAVVLDGWRADRAMVWAKIWSAAFALLPVGTLVGFVGMVADSALGSAWQGRFRCPACDVASEWRHIPGADQYCPEMDIALAGATAPLLARALGASGTDTCPGGQVEDAEKLAHIDVDLCDEHRGNQPFDTRDLHQRGMLHSIGLKLLIDPPRDAGSRAQSIRGAWAAHRGAVVPAGGEGAEGYFDQVEVAEQAVGNLTIGDVLDSTELIIGLDGSITKKVIKTLSKRTMTSLAAKDFKCLGVGCRRYL